MDYYDYMIKYYLDKDEPAGDLARDMDSDKDFPRQTEGEEMIDYEIRILHHLFARKICKDALHIFYVTWAGYAFAKKGGALK